MNNKGFVFVETIVVLVVLITGVLGIYSTYSNVSTNIEKRDYYDNISDLYKTDIIRDKINSSLLSGSGYIQIKTNDSAYSCVSYMGSDCNTLLTELNVYDITINLVSISEMLGLSSNFNNSLVEYMKTISSDDNRYIIVHNSIELHCAVLIPPFS